MKDIEAVSRSSFFSLHANIDFAAIALSALQIVEAINGNLEQLIEILLEYESYEVASDEISRTVDLLSNLEENREYFQIRTGAVTTFLPRNQPLYALTCFVIVPALMSTEVHFRIPQATKRIFSRMLSLLNFEDLVPNAKVSHLERLAFLKDRSALRRSSKTGETALVTEVVIFTGTSHHANQLRRVFDQRTLFITNGAGHNPIVVGTSANIAAAVDATLSVSLYNQGQDCAAPNAVLVLQDVYDEFVLRLRKKVLSVKVGHYSNRECRVGPISIPDDLKGIQATLVDNRQFIDAETPGTIRTSDAIVEPTIVCRPLADGGNFDENFAPLIFVQKYTIDHELSAYFESPKYAENAMYVTLFGSSNYVTELSDRSINGKIIHSSESILRDTHLHAPGVERGTKPYGGLGPGASSISIGGKIIPMATLPQRDIFNFLAQPVLQVSRRDSMSGAQDHEGELEFKKIEKLLRLRPEPAGTQVQARPRGRIFVDLTTTKRELRFLEVSEGTSFELLSEPNVEFIAGLTAEDILLIQSLRSLVFGKDHHTTESFSSAIYSIAKDPDLGRKENSARQLRFFRILYRLMFGADSGPNLSSFLWETDVRSLESLIDFSRQDS